MSRPEKRPSRRARKGDPRLRVLFSARRIRRRVAQLAADITAHHGSRDLLAVAVLKGSFVFTADLARELSTRGVHLAVDFVALSSYGSGTASSGRIRTLLRPAIDVKGRRVLLIDDILDTGRTLDAARRALLARGARQVLTCVLLDKPARRAVPVRADYTGFRVDNLFVVGYGLDFDNRYRNLPYIAALPDRMAAGSAQAFSPQ